MSIDVKSLLKDVLTRRVVDSIIERSDSADVVCVEDSLSDDEVVELLLQIGDKGVLASSVGTLRSHLPLLSACYDIQLCSFRIYLTTPLATSVSCFTSPISPPGIASSTISSSLHISRDGSFVDDDAILSYLLSISPLEKYFVVSSADVYLNNLFTRHFSSVMAIDLLHLACAPLPSVADQSPSHVFILAGQSNMSGRGQLISLDSTAPTGSFLGDITQKNVSDILSCDPKEHWVEST